MYHLENLGTLVTQTYKKLMLMVRKIVLSIVAILSLSFVAVAQNKQVTGTVKDNGGNPIAGALILVDGTTNLGTVSEATGEFKLMAQQTAF